MAIVKMIGKVDGRDIVFSLNETGFWTASIPRDLDGEYIVEVIAYDEAGNAGYAVTILFEINPKKLTYKIKPLNRNVKITGEHFSEEVVADDYLFFIKEKYTAMELPSKHSFKVVS